MIENDGVINNAKKDAIIIELGSHNSEITNNGKITAFGIGISPVSYTHLDVYKRQALFI